VLRELAWLTHSLTSFSPHYSFDEWLEGESRLRKFTPDNELVALRQARNAYLCERVESEALQSQPNFRETRTSSSSSDSGSVELGSKRTADDAKLTTLNGGEGDEAPSGESSKPASNDPFAPAEDDDCPDFVPGSAIVIRFPGNIRRICIADWEAITKRLELVPLPRVPSVSDILAEFAAQKSRTASQQLQVEEVVAGLCVLFDRALPACLLYKFERPQYLDLSRACPGVRPSRIYGAEHLLRLLLKLPALLAHTRMDILELQALEARVNDLIKWLQTRLTCFAAEYQTTEKEYRRRATLMNAEIARMMPDSLKQEDE